MSAERINRPHPLHPSTSPRLSPLDIVKSVPSNRLPPPPDVEEDDGEYTVYAVRWLVLAIFAILTITNAILWISCAPIQSLAADYFGVSKTWINMLSVSYMALYLPGYFLALWSMNSSGSRGGLRWGLCLAASLQTLGAWIRCAGMLGAEGNHAPPGRGFALVMIGQCMAGLAQPMFTNAPARLSSNWFGVSQRNLATTIAAMSNPIGIAIGQLLPTAMVDARGGIPKLMLVSACICTGSLVLCVLFIRREPPTPPSRSTAERRAAKDASDAQAAGDSLARGVGGVAGASAPSFWRSPLMFELRSLLRNRQFWILLFGVGIGLGMFNAVTTLIEQLVRPSGYSKDDAGNFGALLIGCGLVGAAIVGPVMDRTHAYNRLLKVGLIAALAGTVFMLLSLRPGHFGLVAASFAVLGFVMLPLLPVCMECAAECTYPVSEDASSGLMLFAGNFVGIIMIFSVGEMIQDPYQTVFNAASILLASFLVLAVGVVALFYNGPLRRQAAERARSNDRAGLSTEGLETQLLI